MPEERSRYREGPGWDRPGPAGWYLELGRTRPQNHPLQALQAFRGPLRCSEGSLRDGWVVPRYSPPRYPPRYTPPRYPPGYTLRDGTMLPLLGHAQMTVSDTS